MSMLTIHVNKFLEDAHSDAAQHQTMLAKRIRGSRIAAGLSQSALARACAVTPSAINKLEKGDTKSLSAELLLSLSAALKVSAAWLDTGRGSPAPTLQVSIDESEILTTFRKLTNAHQEALLAMSKALLSSQALKPAAAAKIPKQTADTE